MNSPGRLCILLMLAPTILVSMVACRSSPLTGATLALGAETPVTEPFTAFGAFPFLDASHSGPTGIERAAAAQDGAEVFVARYAIVDGDSKGGFLRIERALAEQKGAWRLRTFLEGDSKASDAKLAQEQIIAPAPDGGAALVSLINHADGVIVEFKPKMLEHPAELTPAKPFDQQSQMRLPLIDNPEKTREHGTGEKVLELIGMQTVTAGGKVFECAHVHEVFTSNLSMAKAVRTTHHWYAPGVGLIARTWEEEVRALGIVVRRNAQAIVVLPP